MTVRDEMTAAIVGERAALHEAGGTQASATAGPGEPVAGPGVRRRTGSPDRVFSRDPDAFAPPDGREEEWRFTPMRRLRGLLSGAAPDGKVEVGGAAPEGVTIERVPMDDPRIGRALTPSDRATALAMRLAPEALVVTFAPEVSADVSLRVEASGLAYGHVLVDVGRFARATVVLDHTGSAVAGINVELVVGDSAQLDVVSLQDWSDDAVHLGAHAALVGRDARMRHVAVTLGGDLVRLLPTVRYAGTGGDAEFFGLFFTDAGQHQEHRLFVDHAMPRCRSRVTYKGALQGLDAHAVWIGDVLIRAEAIGTDTYELNRNLVLTDGGRADSVPNLEIETGEVTGAGHASATGRFDDEALFYLMSRGIAADEARRLVVRGFFAEILDQIPVPEVRERVERAVEAELAGVLVGSRS